MFFRKFVIGSISKRLLFLSQISIGVFYKKNRVEKTVIPIDPYNSDDDTVDEDDISDPDYIPKPTSFAYSSTWGLWSALR